MSNRRVVPAVAAVVALEGIAYGVVIPVLPFAFESRILVGLLFATYSACQLIAAPLLGRLSDRHGRKRVLLGSQIGTMVGLAVLAIPSYGAALASRAIDGATAGNNPVAYATAMAHERPERWHRLFGHLAIAGGLGILTGVGAAVLTGGDLLTAALIALGFATAAVAATAVLLPDERDHIRAPVAPPSVRALVEARAVFLAGVAQAACVLPLPAILAAGGASPSRAITEGLVALMVAAIAQITVVPSLLRAPFVIAATVVSSASALGAFLLAIGRFPVVGAAALLCAAVGIAGLSRLHGVRSLSHHGLGTATGVVTMALTAGQLVGPLVGYAALEFSIAWCVGLAAAAVVGATILCRPARIGKPA